MSFPTLHQIVGQPDPIRLLGQSLVDNRLAHAYLFHGPAGIGKKTTALALTQTLYCAQRITNPQTLVSGCGQCALCRKVALGYHPDVLMVAVEEGKIQISVDQIRAVNQFLALTPMESAWKVVILDDARHLNEASANALLKTLEEPSASSVLILISQRPSGLLPTLRSRCQKIRFSLLEPVVLENYLRNVLPDQAADIPHAVALSEGSLAKAWSLCTGNLANQMNQFNADWQDLAHHKRLSPILTLAEKWSDKESFAIALACLRIWFRQTIHGMLGQNEDQACSWLALWHWFDQLSTRAEVFNWNRQLLLEAVFIRVLRNLALARATATQSSDSPS